MATLVYAALIEQFNSNDILQYSSLAYAFAFLSFMASDHFQP